MAVVPFKASRPDRSSCTSFERDIQPRWAACSAEEVLDFHCKKYLRLVLVGKSGTGKSSTGNTILGKEEFEVSDSCSAETEKSYWSYGERFGKKIEIVDTPGLFDDSLDEVSVAREIMKAIAWTVPGPHVILLVTRADCRFTREDAKVINVLRHLFGDTLMQHVITVFTHGTKFSSVDHFRDKYLARPQKALDNLLQDTNQRLVLFNNCETNPRKCQEQVKQLMLVIQKMLEQNGNKSFENKLLYLCEGIMLNNSKELASTLNALNNSTALANTADALVHERQARHLIRAALNERTNALDQEQQTYGQMETIEALADRTITDFLILMRDSGLLNNTELEKKVNDEKKAFVQQKIREYQKELDDLRKKMRELEETSNTGCCVIL